MQEDIRVNKIYKLSDDYNDIFLNNASITNVSYEEVALSSRTIHKDFYEDIFVLEPHKTYKIEFPDIQIKSRCITEVKVFNKVKNSGLIPTVDADSRVIYLYNSNENMIFIQKKTIIGHLIIYKEGGFND